MVITRLPRSQYCSIFKKSYVTDIFQRDVSPISPVKCTNICLLLSLPKSMWFSKFSRYQIESRQRISHVLLEACFDGDISNITLLEYNQWWEAQCMLSMEIMRLCIFISDAPDWNSRLSFPLQSSATVHILVRAARSFHVCCTFRIKTQLLSLFRSLVYPGHPSKQKSMLQWNAMPREWSHVEVRRKSINWWVIMDKIH